MASKCKNVSIETIIQALQELSSGVKIKDDDNIPAPEAPTPTPKHWPCAIVYWRTWRLDFILFTASRMLIPFTGSSTVNNIMLNNKLRSLIFSCNISVVCNELYVVLNNESENKMKAINFVFSILRQTYPIIAHL